MPQRTEVYPSGIFIRHSWRNKSGIARGMQMNTTAGISAWRKERGEKNPYGFFSPPFWVGLPDDCRLHKHSFTDLMSEAGSEKPEAESQEPGHPGARYQSLT